MPSQADFLEESIKRLEVEFGLDAPTVLADAAEEEAMSTIGAWEKPVKVFGGVSFYEGALDSNLDSPTTVCFGYFRTKSGLPPEVEKAREQTKPEEPK